MKGIKWVWLKTKAILNMYVNNSAKYKIIWISFGYSCVPEWAEFYDVEEEVVELVSLL